MAELVDVGELVSLPAAAVELDVHRATVNEMVHDGRLVGIRVGPHWYVRRSELEKFAATYERPKNAPKRRDTHQQQRWREEILMKLDEWHSATAQELDQVIDLHLGNIRKYLSLCEREGLTERDEYGTWSLTKAGVDYIQQAGAGSRGLRAS